MGREPRIWVALGDEQHENTHVETGWKGPAQDRGAEKQRVSKHQQEAGQLLHPWHGVASQQGAHRVVAALLGQCSGVCGVLGSVRCHGRVCGVPGSAQRHSRVCAVSGFVQSHSRVCAVPGFVQCHGFCAVSQQGLCGARVCAVSRQGLCNVTARFCAVSGFVQHHGRVCAVS